MAKTSFALVIVVILLAVIPIGLVYVTSPTPSAPAQIALRAHNWQYLCAEGGGGWAVTATTTADGYLYTLSGGPSPETPLVVDDDLEVLVNGKTVFLDNDNVSTRDGRTIWNGAPITFVASSGDALRIRATNPGGVDSELSPLYLHVNAQFVKLSDGVPKTPSDVFVFFDETFNISIPSEIAITAPKEGQEITWSSEGFLAKGTCSGLGGGLNIYLIVHPLTTDQWRVQNAPHITEEGTWEATVYFGTKDLGAGEDYELYAIITEKTFEKGLIESFPPYVAKSAVRVRRIAVSPLLQQKWCYIFITALIILLVVLFAHRSRKKRAKLSENVTGTTEMKSPKFEINITTDTGFKVGMWEQLHVTAKNVGKGSARNVLLTLSGPLEIGGVKTIPTLDPKAKAEVTVGIKPKEQGKLPLEICVAYTDETGRASKIKEVKYINVAKDDEKVSEQPVTIHIDNIGEIIGSGATKTGDIGILKGSIGATNKPSKKCPNCGKDVSGDEKFCPECGEQLK